MIRRTYSTVLILLPVALAVAPPIPAQDAHAADTAAAIARGLSAPTTDMVQAHVRFLSDDLLQGRAPGTPGAAIAARYIAAQFAAFGLEPAASDGSYYQPVRMVGITPEPRLVFGARRQTAALTYLDDFVAWPERPDASITVDGDVVFVGYGIQAADWRWDDYKSASLTGKILLMLVNDPGLTDSARFRGREMTYHGRWTYKLEQAARMGAVGAILIHTDESATYPWSVVRNSWSGEQIRLDRGTAQTLRFGAWITVDAARRIIAETGADLDLLIRRAQLRAFRPISLDAHAVLQIRSRVRRFNGVNVVARVAGRDPDGRREAVVFTAHYDHLGVGPAANGDSIYNGAQDNASGVAALLAAAAAYARAGPAPQRSVLFLATTAEEAGLHGAKAYVSNPVVPLELTAAAINIDRANLRGLTRDAVALGAEQSALGRYFERAAAAEGLTPTGDPNPHSGSFYRSDHFPFAQAGVPVLAFRTGAAFAEKPAGWGEEQERKYVAQHYHQPSDEVRDDFMYGGVLQQVRLMFRIGWKLAATREFPAWNPGSDFRPAGERLRIRRIRGSNP